MSYEMKIGAQSRLTPEWGAISNDVTQYIILFRAFFGTRDVTNTSPLRWWTRVRILCVPIVKTSYVFVSPAT